MGNHVVEMDFNNSTNARVPLDDALDALAKAADRLSLHGDYAGAVRIERTMADFAENYMMEG